MLPRRPIPLLLVAVAIAGGGLHAMEPCGPWQQVYPLPTRASLWAVTYGDGRFVAVGQGVALVSEDGVVWTEAATLPGVALRSVVWAGDRVVGGGSAGPQRQVAARGDGGAWGAAPAPGTVGCGALSGVPFRPRDRRSCSRAKTVSSGPRSWSRTPANSGPSR